MESINMTPCDSHVDIVDTTSTTPTTVHRPGDDGDKPLADDAAATTPPVYHNDNVADATADDIASLLDDTMPYPSATDLYIASLQSPTSTYVKYPRTAYAADSATMHWSYPSSVALTGYDTRYDSEHRGYNNTYSVAPDECSNADDVAREDIADLMASVADLQTMTDKIAAAIDIANTRLTSLEHSQRIVVEHLAQLVSSLSTLIPPTFESHDGVE
jgi:hypothetical protein